MDPTTFNYPVPITQRLKLHIIVYDMYGVNTYSAERGKAGPDSAPRGGLLCKKKKNNNRNRNISTTLLSLNVGCCRAIQETRSQQERLYSR